MSKTTQDAADTSVEADNTSLTNDADNDSFDDLAADDTSWGDVADDGSDDDESDASDSSDDSDQASDESEADLEDFGDDEAATDDETDDKSDESTEDESTADDKAAADKTDETSEAERLRQESADDAAQKAFQAREAKRLAEKAEAQQEYLDGAEDEQDLAIRQLKVNAYNQTIEATNNKLTNDLDKAVASIDMFRTGTDFQKAELVDAADEFEQRFVRKDANGDPIGIETDPATGLPADLTSFLQKKSASIKRLAAEGAQAQVKAKTNQRKRTLTPPSRAPKKPKTDGIDDGFDEEAARY